MQQYAHAQLTSKHKWDFLSYLIFLLLEGPIKKGK